MRFWVINGKCEHNNNSSIAIEDSDAKWLFVRQQDAYDTAKLLLAHNHYYIPTHIEEIEVPTDELLSMILHYGRKAALNKINNAVIYGYDSEIAINKVSTIPIIE